jgi:hypothetical protein
MQGLVSRTIMTYSSNLSKARIELTKLSGSSEKRTLLFIRASGDSVHPYPRLHDHDALRSRIY